MKCMAKGCGNTVLLDYSDYAVPAGGVQNELCSDHLGLLRKGRPIVAAEQSHETNGNGNIAGGLGQQGLEADLRRDPEDYQPPEEK